MNNIGKRIKELRRKCDLTQEKLADFLGVTYQSVSKWETGATFPDLSLIVPLSRVLGVSTDELLGATAMDERKAYFDAEYHQFWLKDNKEDDLEIARQAIAEYPGEYKYLYWLAEVEWLVAYTPKYFGTDSYDKLMESSIKHFQMIIEDCTDQYIRNKAIAGIVWPYTVMERYDEARKYAEMYPESADTSRDELLAKCVHGDEFVSLRRKIARDKLREFCISLYYMWQFSDMKDYTAMDAEEAIIRAVIDDENYLNFNWDLYFIYLERARIYCSAGEYDSAVAALAETKRYALGYDDLFEKGTASYTCSVLKGYTEDVTDCRDREFYIDFLKETVTKEAVFTPLRGREDFKALFE